MSYEVLKRERSQAQGDDPASRRAAEITERSQTPHKRNGDGGTQNNLDGSLDTLVDVEPKCSSTVEKKEGGMLRRYWRSQFPVRAPDFGKGGKR